MIAKLTKLFLLVLSLLAFLPARAALADIGPKPTMDFQFKQEMTGEPPLTITSGILFECDQPDCSDAAPLEEAGPQRFTCEINSCRATAYGFAPYHRIELEFSDGKTRQSNVFETAGFDSKYMVTIRPDGLLVEARFSLGLFPRTMVILIACCCAVVGVALVAGLMIFFLRRSKQN
jgi:hypothetical protein